MNKQNFFKSSWLRIILFTFLMGLLFFSLGSCMRKKPILIGFVAQLTGKQAELGVQERNGVQLAVEMINSSGGIAGRKIELIIRDDLGIPEKAKTADGELVKSGVVAIIGHSTSGQTMAGLEVTNPAKVVLVGPTVSTPELSGLDDYFFRVYPSFKESARAFAQYIYQRSKLNRLAIIYDMDNAAYTKAYSTVFTDEFKSQGGEIAGEVHFSSASQPDFAPILMQLRENKANGLLIIASDIDTALIAQRTRLLGWQTPLFSSGWAVTEKLINTGGQTVENLKFEQAYDLTSQSPIFLEFQTRYKARFSNTPSFGAALAYDAAMVLIEALEKTEGKAEELRQELLKIRDFQGLTNIFSLDQFGDVERPFYVGSISDGKFVIIDKLSYIKSGGE